MNHVVLGLLVIGLAAVTLSARAADETIPPGILPGTVKPRPDTTLLKDSADLKRLKQKPAKRRRAHPAGEAATPAPSSAPPPPEPSPSPGQR